MKNLLFVFLVLFSTITFGSNYYISNSGSDLADGLTPVSSWQTISKVNSSTFAAGDSILFLRGSTFYGELVASRNNLNYAAYGIGQAPVISGYTLLSSWTDDGAGIWSINVPKAKSSLIVVTINGKLQRLGRFPNAGTKNGGYLNYESFNQNTPSITDNQLTGSSSWAGAEIAIRKVHWIIDRCKVKAQSGGTLTYTNPTSYPGTAGYGYFFQDDIRTLDQFGEWFLNKSTKVLSVYFGTENPASYIVEASTIDTLFNCGGASGRPARSNISVQNIAFEGANKFAFFAQDCSNIAVKNCTFINSNNGVKTWNVANSLTEYCSIVNMLNNGIVQQGVISSPTKVQYNTVRNCGLYAGMGESGDTQSNGIVTNGNNNTVENNRVDSIGFNAIQFNGSKVSIKYNYVTNFTLTKDDGGGIYSWPTGSETGRVVESNIVIGAKGAAFGTTDEGNSAHCIYLDGASNIDVLNNTVSDAGGAGIFLNNNVYAKIKNNTIYDVPVGISVNRLPGSQQPRNNMIENNIVYATKNNFFYWNGELNTPKTITIQNDMRLIGTFDNNFYRNDLAAPFDYYYHLTSGGTFVDPQSLKFSQWQPFINADTNSQLLSTDENVFQYNPTSSSVVYNFPGHSKKDVFGVTYTESYTIPAFSSVVLWDARFVMPPKIGIVTQPTCIELGSVVLDNLPATGTWILTRTPGGTITSGTGSSSTITGLEGGIYTYTVTDGISGFTSVASGNVTISSQTKMPSTPTIGLITQPTCSFATGGVEVTGLPGGTWTLIRNPGEITTTGTGTWSAITGLETGTYTYTVTNSAGCTSIESANVIINMQPQPITPVITLHSDTLHSEATTGNQWYNQNGLIDGAIFQDYIATTNGDYYVIISSDNCISEPSNTIHVIPTGIDINVNNKIFNVYPNPFTNELNIEIKGNTNSTGFEIVNSIGLVVFKGCLEEKIKLQTPKLSPGSYIIKLENGSDFEFKKIVKM